MFFPHKRFPSILASVCKGSGDWIVTFSFLKVLCVVWLAQLLLYPYSMSLICTRTCTFSLSRNTDTCLKKCHTKYMGCMSTLYFSHFEIYNVYDKLMSLFFMHVYFFQINFMFELIISTYLRKRRENCYLFLYKKNSNTNSNEGLV